MERNLLSKVTCLIIILCWVCTNTQSINCQRKWNLFKKQYVEDSYKVRETKIRNCRLLETLDSLMRSKQDSFPDRFWTKMPRILTLFEERCDTTESHGLDGEIIIEHPSKEPTSDNIERIFEGKNPSNDIKIIFSPGIYIDEYIIHYKNKLFGVSDNIYNTLKHKMHFYSSVLTNHYWMLRKPYKVPVFSVVIAKTGKLKEFKYTTIDYYDLPKLD